MRHAINSVGLLPEIGFVHDITPSKLPLVYDLQKLFRWVADLSVIEVVHRGLIDTKKGFLTTENYHTRLEPETARILSNQLSENFGRLVRGGKKNLTVDTWVTEGARTLANWLQAPKGSLTFP